MRYPVGLSFVGLWLAFLSGVGSSPAGAESPDPSNPARQWAADGPGGVPSFSKHVIPLLNKVGCSARDCHGSFQGQNGFRLSLFGYDLALDHKELTADPDSGPRVDPQHVDQSLALQKPLGVVDHEGGQRFAAGDWRHRLFRAWIAAGAKYDAARAATIERLTVTPAEICGVGPADGQQLRVVAHYSDGDRQDVTPLSQFSTNNDAVARVSSAGRVTLAGVGDTAIVITYAGVVQTIPVLSPQVGGKPWRWPPVNNTIDELAAAKLRKLNVRPSELCDDEAFLRRAFVDCIGTLPTPREARAFRVDPRPDKRQRLIDHLLSREEYALYWATLWSDWTGNNYGTLNPNFKTAWLWHDWLKDKLRRNVPYDKIVQGIVMATSLEGRTLQEYQTEVAAVWSRIEPRTGRKNGFDNGTYARRKTLDLYWLKRGGGPEELAIRTANAFLGIQIQCAQCHKHPFDRWTQDDFVAWQSFFMTADVLATDGSKRGNRLDYHKVALYPGPYRGRLEPLKRTPPKVLGGEVTPYVEGGPDPREALWRWMANGDNPWFARSIVNRIWGHYFGVGIVDPVDDFNAANPPSNPALLDWLARDFIEHGYDLKHLQRRIMNSRTYQLSHVPNESNRSDRRNFSRAQVRRLQAEVLADAIDAITGVPTRYSSTFVPPGTPAIGIAPTRIGRAETEYVFHIFGRPKRQQTCACERSTQTALVQALYLLNDADVSMKIADPTGRAAQLARSGKSQADIVEELFLMVLARSPTEAERRQALEHFQADGMSRQAGVEDVMWALLNVREFVFVR